MDDLDKLPSDLVWEQDGHLSDIVLSTIADGETQIVPHEALGHLEHCDHCSTRFGAEALLSMHTRELLGEYAKNAAAPMSVKPRVAQVVPEKRVSALPKRAVVGALVLATLGALPGILHSGGRIMSAIAWIGRGILLLSRGIVVVAKSETATPLLWAAAAVFLVFGLVVSRSARPGSASDLAQEGSV